MTYPIIRWSGGGGGVLPSAPATVRFGENAFLPPMLLTPTMTASALVASAARASGAAGSTGPGADASDNAPTEAALARCRCVLGLAGDLPADLAASALEACSGNPSDFISSLESRGLDTSACAAGGEARPVWQSPWVIGGAAALLLGGVAFVALR